MEPPFESLGGRGGQQGAVPGPEPEDGVQYEIEAVLDERGTIEAKRMLGHMHAEIGAVGGVLGCQKHKLKTGVGVPC